MFSRAYQNFFCVERKHRFTRWRSSYVTIRFMEVQKWWIWGKKRENTFRNSKVTRMFYYHISCFLTFIWAASALGTPQGRTVAKCLLHTVLHPHSQGSNSWRDYFYIISFITISIYTISYKCMGGKKKMEVLKQEQGNKKWGSWKHIRKVLGRHVPTWHYDPILWPKELKTRFSFQFQRCKQTKWTIQR